MTGDDQFEPMWKKAAGKKGKFKGYIVSVVFLIDTPHFSVRGTGYIFYQLIAEEKSR